MRPVADHELPALAALLASIDGETPRSLDLLRTQLARIRAVPGYTVFVVLADDKVIATFSQLIFPTLAHGGASESLLESVVVADGLRGQGIGRRMMQFAMQRAADAGCYKLALSSNSKRLDAHRFYRGMGFEQHGISFSIQTQTAAVAEKEHSHA